MSLQSPREERLTVRSARAVASPVRGGEARFAGVLEPAGLRVLLVR